MSTDWYRRHLGPPPAAPQRQPVMPQPTQFVVVDGRAYPREDQGQPAVPQEEMPPQPWLQPANDVPIGQVRASDAIRVWRGTREAQASSGACPVCGSKDYMPRLPNGRIGHCFSCSYRPETGDDRGGPTIQPRISGGVSADGSPIPVEQARGTGRAFAGMVSGRFSKTDLVGKA